VHGVVRQQQIGSQAADLADQQAAQLDITLQTTISVVQEDRWPRANQLAGHDLLQLPPRGDAQRVLGRIGGTLLA
jgi:hypothetical protein